MKYLKIFENVNNSQRINEILLNLARMVSSELSGSNVHPSEDFNVVELYTLVLGEEKLLLIINKVLDERLVRENDNSIHKYHKSEFDIDINTLEIIADSSAPINRESISFYDIYSLLENDYRKKLSSQFTTWDDVKKIERNRD